MADTDVQKIKDKLSIVEVVGQYVKLKKAGRNYSGLCPFHKERTPSFMVSPERGTYMCFGCGENGDIFSFVQKLEGIDFPTALKQLAERAGVTLEKGAIKRPETKEKEERVKEVCEEATKFFESELEKRADVLAYLHSRGVQSETIAMWRLGYASANWRKLSEYLISKGFTKEEIVEAGLAIKSDKKPGEVYDRFRGRIMFPIFDTNSRVIAYSGRFFEKVEGSHEETEPAKYVNSPETVLFKKSRVLYGLDKAKNYIRKLDCILLVEGQFDVIMSHQSGYPIAVALSGTALTQEHLSLMGRFTKNLILALDADEAGVRAGLKSALMALKAGFDVKIPTFTQGKDPADVAKENAELLKAAIRTSKPAVEFFLDAMRQGARDERAYKKAVETNVIPLIAAIESRIDQAHFISLVAQRLSVPDSAVAAEVLKHTPEGENASPQLQTKSEEFDLSAMEKKVAMLLFFFGHGSEVGARLKQVWGEEKLQELEKRVGPEAEHLRFLFEKELGEHTTEAVIAEEMLAAITATVEKSRFKMKFL
jgi:DNA primase